MSLFVSIKRTLRSGLIGFLRNGFVSLSSILVLTITLFAIASSMFVGASLDAVLNQIKDKVDINVYFTVDANEEDILSIKKTLDVMPEVAAVEYISKSAALERFKERHKNDQLTLQALEELDDNPLGASFAIRAKETNQYEAIAKFLESDPIMIQGEDTIIEKVNYFQNKIVIDKLTAIISASEKIGLAIIILLVIAAMLIAFNTIRLAIYTMRDEVAVMRLVGAGKWYARGPFVIEGTLYGFTAGIVTLLLLYPITFWLGPMSEQFFGNFNTFTFFVTNFAKISGIIIGSGIALGAFSSYLAVRRYLDV